MGSKRKIGRKPSKISTSQLCGMGVLCALAVIFACFARGAWPAATFLEYSPADVPILIGTFMYGPVAGILMSLIVAVLQGVTVSASSGIIGIVMNFVSMVAFVFVAGLIYKKWHTLKGALLSLGVGALTGVIVMILWNIILTPLYMDVSREVVIGMLPTVFLPFNLVRYAANAVMTFILYKATRKFFGFLFKNLPDIKLNNKLSGEYESGSEEETFELAKRVADTLEGGETIVLEGELGAGKTTFTKGIAAALGVTEEVTSPTFTLMNVYESGRLPLCHLDMYRLESADEVEELGLLDTAPENAVKVIEWNKFTDLTGRVINVKIAYDGEHDRVLTLTDSADGERTSKRFAARKNASRKEGNGGPAHEHSLS